MEVLYMERTEEQSENITKTYTQLKFFGIPLDKKRLFTIEEKTNLFAKKKFIRRDKIR